MSKLEENLRLQLKHLKVATPEREYRFAAHAAGGPGRGLRRRLQEVQLKDWRFDFAWPQRRFAVEVEGGAHIGGRHNRGKGFEEDLLKYHHAVRLGWTVYRCSGPLIDSWMAAYVIRDLLDNSNGGTQNG